jgi:DNA-binding GntR family transcriptional regulator
MNRVVNILMKRDEYDEEEATELVRECRAEMLDAIESGDYDLAEDILASDLGLEPDYIFDIL